MNYSKHCNLCENEITNLENGLTCSLTSKKPEFKNICPKINLNNKFQEKLERTNLELERIRKKKKSVHLSFYFIIIIGFFLIIGGISFVREIVFSVYTLYFSYGIITTGVTFLAVGYNKLNKFRTELYNSEYEKNEIDEFYEKYGIVYKTEFNFEEKIHGIQEVIVKMEFKNWKKKRTETTYKINC